MSQGAVAVIVIVAIIIVVAFLAWMFTMKRRSERLRERFGPEYDRRVDAAGGKRKAEAELAARQERVERYHLRPLAPEDRQRYVAEWTKMQARFVENPGSAIADADRLIGEVMAARGYPVADFEQNAADISVDHPVVVENYRAGHAIAVRHASGQASTEDLRQCMLHYRRLFDELTSARETVPARVA